MKKSVFTMALRLCAVITFLCMTFETGNAQVQEAFNSLYSTNSKGNIVFVGNTLMTCPSGGTCATAQNGGVDQNNSFDMNMVDVDADGTTKNSSSAQFTLPTDGAVLYAGLFWGGVSTNANIAKCKFATPASGGYVSITGTSSSSSYGYQGYKDVTSLVQAGGSGTYWTAGVQLDTGTNTFGGWTLAIVFEDPSQSVRNMNVFKGLALVSQNNTSNLAFNISGFQTPQAGTVKCNLGFVSYDGDLGSNGSVYQGDALKLNNTLLGNTINPTNDFFNSTITYLNSYVTTRNPSYQNTLGFDADIVNADGIFANSATSATIHLTTGGESYVPGVITTAITLFAPDVSTTKTATDVNGGYLEPGDTLLYTLSLTNQGDDGATKLMIADTIPANATYVPGSLTVTAGPNLGAKTDATGDDQAEYFSAGNYVLFRLGNGATADSGGALAKNGTGSVTFKVRVNSNVLNGTIIYNQAHLGYGAQTLTQNNFTASSYASNEVVSLVADLLVTNTPSAASVYVTRNDTFTVRCINLGPKATSSAKLVDSLPAGFTYVSSAVSVGAYNHTTGLWTIGAMAVDDTVTLTLVATVTSLGAKTTTAVATNLDPLVTDAVLTNNTAIATVTGVNGIDLSPSTKSYSDVNGGTINAKDTILFTIKVFNTGNITANTVTIKDTLLTGYTIVTGSISNAGSISGTKVITFPTFNLNAGDSASRTYRVTIDSTNTDQSSVPNYASITSGVTTVRVGTSVTVNNRPTMQMTKTVDKATAVPGDTLTYTISYHNTGSAFAGTVKIDEDTPVGTTYITGTVTLNSVVKTDVSDGDEVTVTSGHIVVNIGSVAVGASGNVTFKVRVK